MPFDYKCRNNLSYNKNLEMLNDVFKGMINNSNTEITGRVHC